MEIKTDDGPVSEVARRQPSIPAECVREPVRGSIGCHLRRSRLLCADQQDRPRRAAAQSFIVRRGQRAAKCHLTEAADGWRTCQRTLARVRESRIPGALAQL